MAIDVVTTTTPDAAIGSSSNISSNTIKPKRRRRKRPLERNEINSLICVASLTALYLFFLFQTSRVLDSLQEDRNASGNFRFHGFLYDTRQNVPTNNKKSNNNTKNTNYVRTIVQRSEDKDEIRPTKYLIFVGQFPGQGTGNIISGLLAAHLLGEEFHRVVCVQDYPAFTDFFDSVHPITKLKCPSIVPAKFPPADSQHHITLINFYSAPDECDLQDRLNSDVPILFMTGNTYPRWPKVPDNFFFRYYQAQPKLLAALPYNPQSPPTTVVHLREPDSVVGDARKGLDDVSLTALGQLLPKGSDTYLVTNNVAYYPRFEECCQWSHPHWDTVRHSAMGKEWGPHAGQIMQINRNLTPDQIKEQQNLQMWSDWYTLLTAKAIYHTHSDFSISAIHWTNKVEAHNLQGMQSDGRTLKMVRESWWVDGETEPLSQRTRTARGTAQLRLCRE